MTDLHPGPEIEAQAARLSPGKQLLLDLGPLLLYFLAFKFAPGDEVQRLLIATGGFLAAMVVAMVVGYRATGKVTTLQLISVVLVAVSAAITWFTRDEQFIKMKPTFFYLLAAAILGFGLVTRRNLLKALLGAAYPGVSPAGWSKLSRNWAIFFVFLACLNEVVWRNSSTSFWLGFKIWGFLPLTFLFAASQMPMLLRNGLDMGQEKP
ncbi:inner membrane-spanning protein YciB [Sphingomicrobium astaxanthinifaciens]|uniref:inner membrane-spanning protein YciB n=1 Tax=Sphingomicrobium astaxanthinifaciens TaxID=1227949 RepID=UPI001FCBF4E3|nr:inner membrane-spanning protein YciB [Sphingomicrobium astaxanthinifaciens]MCJ7422270.1 septation protein IspZ [Sphingomicrobium astaxanthinifaciens]